MLVEKHFWLFILSPLRNSRATFPTTILYAGTHDPVKLRQGRKRLEQPVDQGVLPASKSVGHRYISVRTYACYTVGGVASTRFFFFFNQKLTQLTLLASYCTQLLLVRVVHCHIICLNSSQIAGHFGIWRRKTYVFLHLFALFQHFVIKLKMI